MLGGDAKILRDRQHEAAAERVPVDRGDGDLRQAPEAVHQLRLAQRQRFRLFGPERRHLGDVVAGAERAPAAGDDQHPHVVARGDALHRVLECSGERTVQGVERLGTAERETRDTVGDVGERRPGAWSWARMIYGRGLGGPVSRGPHVQGTPCRP